MSILFVEQLTVIDCAYLHAQRGLVGESWIVDLELEGELDAQSMVLDFGEVKRRLKRAIDDGVDHTLVVPARSPRLRTQRREGADLHLVFDSTLGMIEHSSPAHAVTLIEATEVSTEAVQSHVGRLLRDAVPANVLEARPRLRHEVIDGAWYHYTHGLKKHAGHCQRIAHGHRSRIEIRRSGRRDPLAEQQWAGRWRDIYLGTREDLVSEVGERMEFGYRSAEGKFALSLPAARCELIEADTTVERLAEWIADQVSGNAQVEVRAYEGVMKGAIARRDAGGSSR